MGLISATTDYTDRDFDSIKMRLRNLVLSVFPEWTDQNAANFGNILLELYAFVGDVLTYYQDNQALQSRITTATERQAMLGLCKLIGYSPSTASAATVDLTITLAEPPTDDVTFTVGEYVLTSEVTDPIRYQLLSTVQITAGQNPPTVEVEAENSESQSESFTSTGLGNQEIRLGASPYIDTDTVITADNGSYTAVDNFLASTSSDRHYTVTVDQADQATIRFGNGSNGAIPVGTISAGYKTGGGAAGRVEANKLIRFETSSRRDDSGNPVVATVTNPLASSGGTDRESVAQIRINAPASISANTRTVTKTDYETNARRVSGVARALMLTSNEDAGVTENTGILLVVPEGGGLPTQTLKDAVYTSVTETYPNTLTFRVLVQDPSYLSINVTAAVFLARGAVAATVRTAIESALTNFFAVSNDDGTPNTNVDFGANILNAAGEVTGELAWSDVFNVVRDVSGVRKLGGEPGDFALNDEQDDVILDTTQFPVLGTVTLINGDTGDPL